MATVALRLNTTQVERTIAAFRQRYPQAIARALNRSIVSARTTMVKNVAADIRLPSATVKAQMVTREARPDHLQAALEVRGKRIPLIQFGARGPEPSRGKGRGVSVKTPAGRLPHAFITTMRTGHRGVFQRKGRMRLPIREKFGPSLPHVFNKHIPAGLVRGEQALAKNLQSEIRHALRQSSQG